MEYFVNNFYFVSCLTSSKQLLYVITPYIRMLDSDWLIAVIFFFLQIQALQCEFTEFLLHVGVSA